MIAVIENDRVFGNTCIFQLAHVLTYKRIHHRQPIIILGPIFTRFWRVRMIGRDRRFRRIMNFVFLRDVVPNLAFMANRVIKYCEKRLTIAAVFPVFALHLIPNLARFLHIVVLFRFVRAKIPRLPQELRIHLELSRHRNVGAHVLAAKSWRIHARNDRCPCRRTNGSG